MRCQSGGGARDTIRMPQRGIGLQPKVGTPAPTLGEYDEARTTPNGVVADVMREQDVVRFTTA